MQGIESLDNFKSFVSSLGGLGRFEDTYIVHAAEGETVVPMEVLDKNPALKKRLFKTMMDMGIEPGRYIVGNELNSKNPVTGQPEFFLKKIVSQIRKALPGDTEQFLGPIVGLATGSLPLGAIAGAIGSGVPGAIAGGGLGLTSPGLSAFGGKAGGIMELLRGAPAITRGVDAPAIKATQGLFGAGGKFGFGEGTIADAFNRYMGFGKGDSKGKTFEEFVKDRGEEAVLGTDSFKEKALYDKFLEGASRDDKLSLAQLLKAGVPLTLALGYLIDETTDTGPVGAPIDPVTGEVISSILNPIGVSPSLPTRAEGGVMDLRQGGESEGPGTGTSDDIPAMLSDGEFVMTAKAVRGAGGGDRREGAKRMYEAMDRLEAQA